jgi:hypothetical protein
MKIELLTNNGIKGAFRELNIQATRLYKGTDEFNYSVWEIEKSDFDKLKNTTDWNKGWGWFGQGGSSRRGTACGFLTINNEFLIGWDTDSGQDTYDKLSDYLKDGLGSISNDNVCATLHDLCKANGLSLSALLKKFQG